MHWQNLKAGSFCLAIVLSCMFQTHVSSQELRTWTDTTGGFAIEAILTSQDEGSISLKTVDGRMIKVPKSKLSASDLNYLKLQPTSTSRPSASATEGLLTTRLKGSPVQASPNETLSDLLGRIGASVYVDHASLNQIGITWYRLRTVLVVCSRKSAQRNAMEALAYRIPIPRNDPSAVVKRIQAVEPSSWDALGGSGSIVVLPGVVMIRQTGEIHRQLANQLGLRSLPHRYVHPLDNEVISIRVDDGNLDDFLRQLEAQLNRKVTLSESGADGAQLTVDLVNVSAADALKLVLSQYDYQWIENRDGLELVSNAYIRERLEQRRVTIPLASPQISSLIQNSVMKLVEPRTWAPLGGPGQIQHAGGKSFQVSQTQPVFRKLDQLIADLSGPG